MKRTRAVGALLALVIAASGCSAVRNVGGDLPGDVVPRIYGGVRWDAYQVWENDGCHTFALFGIVDFPFSLVLDTVVLPFTIVTEVFGIEMSRKAP